MKLVVGLGNPGKKYENTRHNAGKIVVESLSKDIPNLALEKTDVFMNESGPAVKRLLSRYHTPPADLLIIHDDLDIPLGAYKLQLGKGPRLHNGVNSVEKELGTKDFWRLRVGVENRTGNYESRIGGEEYVLQKFTRDEEEILKRLIKDEIMPEIKNWLLKS